MLKFKEQTKETGNKSELGTKRATAICHISQHILIKVC